MFKQIQMVLGFNDNLCQKMALTLLKNLLEKLQYRFRINKRRKASFILTDILQFLKLSIHRDRHGRYKID